jgi:hypothetical protein
MSRIFGRVRLGAARRAAGCGAGADCLDLLGHPRLKNAQSWIEINDPHLIFVQLPSRYMRTCNH